MSGPVSRVDGWTPTFLENMDELPERRCPYSATLSSPSVRKGN